MYFQNFFTKASNKYPPSPPNLEREQDVTVVYCKEGNFFFFSFKREREHMHLSEPGGGGWGGWSAGHREKRVGERILNKLHAQH